MADPTNVPLTTGLPETVLAPQPGELRQSLEHALASPAAARMSAVAAVAADHPRYLDAWARMAELAAANDDHVAAYAYARVGYHRGLDAARASGWRGSGYVRWRHPENRGFLRSIEELRRAAEAIGEEDEAERCRVFLLQLDPDWPRRPAEQ